MRRIVSIWLPAFAIDRLRRDDCRKPQAERLAGLHDGSPFALSAKEGQRLVIAAANRPAVEAGITPGMGVADALAMLPSAQHAPGASLSATAARCTTWRAGACATRRGRMSTARTGCGSTSPARRICSAAR